MARHEAWRHELDDATQSPLEAAIAARPMQLDIIITAALAQQTFPSQADVVRTIAERIRCAIGRALNDSELTKLEIATALQWNATSPRLSPWVCSDGSYFARDVDATQYQKTLDAKRDAMRARLMRAAARLAAMDTHREDAADD